MQNPVSEMHKQIDVSVLMSLYWRERAEYLAESLESVWNQTAQPREVVMVLDGPVGDDLRHVVDSYAERKDGPELQIVALKENGVLGRALAEGMKHCHCELVARMDTDDVMMPERLEHQWTYMRAHGDVAVCGAWIDEFVTGEKGEKTVVATRKLPEGDEEIKRFGKGRNPMNHPVVMFRKSCVEAAGGYEHFPLFEDYYLWVKMMVKDEIFHNLQESLLMFRQSSDVYRRRGGWRYALDEIKFQRAICRLGFIGTTGALKNIGIRFGVRIMPNGLRSIIYKKLLRK